MDDEAPLLEAALEPPRTWQVVLSNVLVMGFCLLCLPAFVASFWHWDPCSTVTGLFFGAPILSLGVLSWRGLVRRHAASAELVAAGSFAVAMLLCLPALGIFGQFVTDHRRSVWMVGASLLCIAAAAAALWCCLVNRQWAAALKGPPQPYDPVAAYYARKARREWNWPAPRFTLQEVLLAMAAMAWVFGAARWHVQGFKPRAAEHVGREDSPITLPLDATDVTYSQFSHSKTVDFSCSEATFLEWLEVHKTRNGKLEKDPGGWRYFAIRGRPDNFVRVEYDLKAGRAHYSSASR